MDDFIDVAWRRCIGTVIRVRRPGIFFCIKCRIFLLYRRGVFQFVISVIRAGMAFLLNLVHEFPAWYEGCFSLSDCIWNHDHHRLRFEMKSITPASLDLRRCGCPDTASVYIQTLGWWVELRFLVVLNAADNSPPSAQYGHVLRYVLYIIKHEDWYRTYAG